MSEIAVLKEEHSGRPEKHGQIVAAARKLFLESGYGAVSMDAIAAEADVSKRTVYSHFQNKENLFGAVIGDMCAEMGGPNASAFSADLPPAEALKTYGRQILRVALDPKALAVFRVILSESAQFPELSRMFCSGGPDAMCGLLSGYLDQLGRDGILDIDDANRAAEQFIGMIKGPFFISQLFGVSEPPTQAEIESALDQAVSVFLNGVKSRG